MTTPRVQTAFPPGFWERWQTGPCNNALCRHLWCPVQREELRVFAMAQLARQVRHAARKRLVQR